MTGINSTISCLDGTMFSNNIESNTIIFQKTLPFKQFYGNIKKLKIDNYIFYDLKYHHFNNNNYGYDYSNYQNYKSSPETQFPFSNVPVYFRDKLELVEMFNNEYYLDFFNYDGLMSKNPSINVNKWYSELCGRYVISPTIMPLMNDEVIPISLNIENGEHVSAMHFYLEPMYILDMYKMYKNLNEKNSNYIIWNALESGSLPEVMHFHIFNCELPLIDYSDDFEINGYIFGKVDDVNTTFGKMHVIKLKNNFMDTIEFLKHIPLLFWKLRYHRQSNYSYKPIIWFLNNKGDDLLLFTFRKVNINNITVVPHPLNANKFDMNPKYYKEMYGDKSLKDFIYLPIGVISYKNMVILI